LSNKKTRRRVFDAFFYNNIIHSIYIFDLRIKVQLTVNVNNISILPQAACHATQYLSFFRSQQMYGDYFCA